MMRAAARRASRFLPAVLALAAIAACVAPASRPTPATAGAPGQASPAAGFEALLDYIEKAWTPLTRSAACSAARRCA